MYFSDYKQHSGAKINPALFSEYDLNNFDYKGMRNVVVQRVIERGNFNDFYAIFNLYGEDEVIAAIKEIPSLNAMDISFVTTVFDIPLNQLKCKDNGEKPLRPQNWN